MLALSPGLVTNSSRRSKAPIRFSLKSFRLCPELQQQLKDTAIRYISADLQKTLTAFQQSEFIAARNRIDVPHGMFGLSLDNFYLRRKENTVYLNVLELVCKKTLAQAKISIVLDDLQHLLSRLFNGYQANKMASILKDIRNSVKLLTISDTIAMNFKTNSETLRKLHEKLDVFNIREANAVAFMNDEVYGVQNNCVESEIIVDPIEFRYKLNFHNRTTEQSKEESNQAVQELQSRLDHIQWARSRENDVTAFIRMKQKNDIELLKSRVAEMSMQYDRDYESLDGQISYKINTMEVMRDHHKDCLDKMDFFATEMVRLRIWERDWENKKRDDAQKKKGGKKQKKKTQNNDATVTT